MSRQYDSRTTMFSPEGRLYQVEYALNAVRNTLLKAAVLADDSVIFAGELPRDAKLLENTTANNFFYKIDAHIVCVAGGLASDAEVMVQSAQKICQNHRLKFSEPMPVEMLVKRLANVNQSYTQFGSYRPYGCSLIFAGWDKYQGLQLMTVEPSGNYQARKAHAMGKNAKACLEALSAIYGGGEGDSESSSSSSGANDVENIPTSALSAAATQGTGEAVNNVDTALQGEERPELLCPSLEDGLKMTVRVFGKSLDSPVTSEKIDIGILQLTEVKKNYSDDDVDLLGGSDGGYELNFRQLTVKEKKALIDIVGPVSKEDK